MWELFCSRRKKGSPVLCEWPPVREGAISLGFCVLSLPVKNSSSTTPNWPSRCEISMSPPCFCVFIVDGGYVSFLRPHGLSMLTVENLRERQFFPLLSQLVVFTGEVDLRRQKKARSHDGFPSKRFTQNPPVMFSPAVVSPRWRTDLNGVLYSVLYY